MNAFLGKDFSKIFFYSFALLSVAVMVGVPVEALANSGGTGTNLGGFVTDFKEKTLIPLLEFGVFVAYAAGVGVMGVGINKFIKVSKGDPQTTPGEAAAYTFGGGGLMALGFLANYAANSMVKDGDNPDGTWMNRSELFINQAADALVSVAHALPFYG